MTSRAKRKLTIAGVCYVAAFLIATGSCANQVKTEQDNGGVEAVNPSASSDGEGAEEGTDAAGNTEEGNANGGSTGDASDTSSENLTSDIDTLTNYEDFESLAELAEQYGFKLGIVFGGDKMRNKNYQNMLAHHFNSLTAGNEFKTYALLKQGASQKNPDGMPVMDFTYADAIMEFAVANGIAVRGHTLVWDSFASDWFFREGYKNDGAYVDRETARARLQYYIEEVISHFELNYPGVVYCWDVVNEAVSDNVAEFAEGDKRGIKNIQNGAPSLFYTYVGSDYVELSFLYAKDTVEKLKADNPDVDIKLFYNDFNTFYDKKRDSICALVESINTYAQDADGNNRKLIDGIGMQSYIGGYGKQDGCMNEGDLSRVEKAIRTYGDLGLEVHATELAVRNYQNDEETMAKHADFYQKLFKVYMQANDGESKPLTSVSIWGICDDPNLKKDSYGYKMNGPYCGLFDEKLNVKDSFRNVYRALSGEEQ